MPTTISGSLVNTATAQFNTWQNTAGVARNTVLQVVQTVKTDTFTTTSTTYTDITGMSVTIAPYFATSKILVELSLCFTSTINTQAYVRLMRDSTAICIGDTNGSRVRFTMNQFFNQENEVPTSSILFFDSPATSSALVYKVQAQTQGAGTVFVNRSSTWSNDSTSGTGISIITVMEIAQ